MADKGLQHNLFCGLAGILLTLTGLWLVFIPDSVTRAEMVSYVRETSTEHLRLLRVDINEMRHTLDDIKTKVTTIEVGLIGRESDGQ